MMFERLFGRRTAAAEGARKRAASLGQRRPEASAVHLQGVAEELMHRQLAAMRSGRGVHIESLLGGLGSLAGFCCIDSTLKQVAAIGQNPRVLGILDVETADGNRYYLGEPINELLAGGKTSLWAMVAGMISQLGSQDYPDFAGIAAHVAATLGDERFGHPRLPPEHQPGDLPITYVRSLWPVILPLLEARVPVLRERVLVFGFAIQNAMDRGKDLIPPALAGQLVMECAVPMSKLDPGGLWP